MALYGLIIFIIYGWVEFEAMAHMVEAIGGLFSFLGIFLTAIIGIRLLKSQSAIVMAAFHADLAKGQMNTKAIGSSVSLLCGAILMLIPGYVTDAMGLCCFIPGLRTIIGTIITSRFHRQIQAGFMRGAPFNNRSAFTQSFQQHSNPASSDDYESYEEPHRSEPQKSGHKKSGDVIEGEFKEKN